MAIRDANPSNVGTVAAAAAALDVIRLAPGRYGGLPVRSGLVFRAVDHGVGRVVGSEVGHLGAAMGVAVTGPLNIGPSNVEIEGVFHDTRDYSGINAGVITGHNVIFRDCVAMARPRSGARQIGYTVGSGSTRVSGFKYLRGRHHQTGQRGQKLDHAIYLKNADGWLIEDTLVYDGGMFPLHLYTNADHGVARRVVVWDSIRGVTFSGASDSSTGTAAYGTSDHNIVERSIFGKGQSGYLVETWTSDSSRPVQGNVVRDGILTRAGGGAAPFQSGMRGVTIDNCPDIDPGFRDPARGDFRLSASSPGLGYGPAMIQPGYGGGTPPPGPLPPPDTRAPVVSITSPLPDAVVAGLLRLAADVTDDVAVKDVVFHVRPFTGGGTVTALTRTAPPWEGTWDSTTVADGDYTLEAVARDTSGNETIKRVNFLIDNVAEPAPGMTAEEATHRLYQARMRLQTVEGWTRLTAKQREDTIAARNAVDDVRRNFFGDER